MRAWWGVMMAAAAAHAGWNADLSAVSDYVSRGVSQTGGGPALQLAASAGIPAGFYLSGWGSQVDYAGADTHWELSAGAGWAGTVGVWELDLGVQRIHYPGEIESTYPEVALQAAGGPLTMDLVWSPDMAASGSAGGYLALSGQREAGPVRLRSGLGWSWYHRTSADVLFGEGSHPGFVDWHAGVATRLAGVEVGLDWHGTDVHGNTLNPGQAGQRVVLSLCAGFGSE
jgi:uncharacterized protein (TIGR02001 family)